MAAKEFEAAEQDISYSNSRFQVAGTDLSIDLSALAARQPEQRIFRDSTTAVADALARHGLAAQASQLQMPLSPSRLWHWLQASKLKTLMKLASSPYVMGESCYE